MRQTTISKLGFAATSDFDFLRSAHDEALSQKIPFHMGKVASLDRFYGHDEETYRRLSKLGICAVEMEAATVLAMAATPHNHPGRSHAGKGKGDGKEPSAKTSKTISHHRLAGCRVRWLVRRDGHDPVV